MKIEKPDWKLTQQATRPSIFTPSVDLFLYQTDSNLDKWFEDSVEPINKMLSEAAEVQCDIKYRNWSEHHYNPTHKAFLINVTEIKEPIKPETRGEIAIRLLDQIYQEEGAVGPDWWDECKALLEES